MAYTRDTFKIYDEYVQTAQMEMVADKINLFNEATNNAIILDMGGITGDFSYETFFPDDATEDNTRDETDITTGATFGDITQKETVAVDLAFYKAYKKSLAAWYKIGQTPEALSRIAGEYFMRGRIRTLLKYGIGAIDASIRGIGSDVIYDGTSDTTTTMTYDKIVDAKYKFGDAADRLGVMLVHSKVFADLLKNVSTENIFNITDMAIKAVQVPAYGMTIVQTDNAALVGTGGDAGKYYSYLLSQGACKISQGVMDSTTAWVDGDNVNVVGKIRTDYNVKLQVKGCSWDVANGGANPSYASVATATNWDKVATSIKDTAGVKLITT